MEIVLPMALQRPMCKREHFEPRSCEWLHEHLAALLAAVVAMPDDNEVKVPVLALN
jgi:hypothetical protein